MAYRKVNDISLASVADAIRAKGGTSDALVFPDGFVSAISAIQTGGGGGGGGGGGSSEVLDALIDRSITEISNDHITSIGFYAFAYCMNLTTADFPACESIGNLAFGACINMTTVDFPAATSIGEQAFASCMNLTTVDFPVTTSIGGGAFSACTGLTTVDFPATTSIGGSAFSGCTGLTTADFPATTSIGNSAFHGCSGLISIILRKTEQICTLNNKGAFYETPIASGTGYIYVPAALVDSYKAATNWTTYADQIRAIEDYPEITGG